MIGQYFRAAAWRVGAGIVLLSAASLVVAGGERRVGLDAQLLASSRGGDQSFVLGQTSCNTYNGWFVCGKVGDDCISCQNATFTQAVAGTNGGYYPSNTSGRGCGFTFNGTCNANLQCGNFGNPTGNCTALTSPLIQP